MNTFRSVVLTFSKLTVLLKLELKHKLNGCDICLIFLHERKSNLMNYLNMPPAFLICIWAWIRKNIFVLHGTEHTHTFCPSVLQILDGYWRQEGKRKLHNLPLFILILTLHLEKMKDNSDQCLFSSIAFWNRQYQFHRNAITIYSHHSRAVCLMKT